MLERRILGIGVILIIISAIGIILIHNEKDMQDQKDIKSKLEKVKPTSNYKDVQAQKDIIVETIEVESISNHSEKDMQDQKDIKLEPQKTKPISNYERDIQDQNEVIVETTKAEPISNYTQIECLGNAGCHKVKITKIIDGDTINVSNGERIRLAIVNTPEVNETGYEQAKKFWQDRCPVGTDVIVDYDDLQGRSYNRIVAAVYCDNMVMNAELVKSDHAKVWKKYCAKSEFGETDWAKEIGC